ncbi:MAG: hypothetical protein M1840_005444 [Geoglossum simile]|nr:MAG: hypothetical protein M1840_005444 [Geoglossum simile]
MDDLVFHDHQRAILVAVMDMRVDRILHRGSFHLHNGSDWGDLPSLVPSHFEIFFRDLGLFVAGMACIWYGVQAWIGGTCVYLMIRSIWSSWETVPNSMPKGNGTNTRDWASLEHTPASSRDVKTRLKTIKFPVHQIRHLFTVKSFVVPTAGIAFFIWAIVKAHGIGPIVHQPNKIHGSELAWAMVKGIMSSIANFATLIVNDPDFARFAIKPKDALWSQLFTIPCGFAFTSFIGIIVSSSSTVIYKEPIWNPLELLGRFLDEGGSGTRAGVFFISFAFALAQLGTNIAANSVSAGTDLTALLPRFINIRRGGYVCALVGLVMCPWNLLSSSNNFTTYLSSYSVFLSSIAGVLISDYYFVRKGYLQVKDLYSARKSGPYFYFFGINWRAYAAYIAGILINVVGFAGAIGRKVPVGAQYVYNLNFFCGFIVASTIYYLLCRFFPVPAVSTYWLEVGGDITDMPLAYEDSSSYDEESAVGKDPVKSGEVGDVDSPIRKVHKA